MNYLIDDINVMLYTGARRIGTTPQNFNGKMKRESFTIAELEDIAHAVNSSFERKFVLKNGEKV